MTFLNIFQSRTVWTAILMFVTAGVFGLSDVLPTNVFVALEAILGVLNGYFRVNTRVKFDK